MKIIKPEQPLPSKNLMAVIYGPPGVGKTSLAFTTQLPLLMDFDKGIHRAVGRKDVLDISLYEEINTMIEKDELKEAGYKTAIIDTGGTCIDNFIADYVCRIDFKNKRGDGSLTLSGYGAAKVVFGNLVKYIKSKNMDLIVICHSVEKETAGDNLRLRPKMTGGSYDILMAEADMVGYIEMINNKSTINFNPTDKHVGKNCGELMPINLPHYTDPNWDGFLGRLIEDTKAKISQLTDEQTEAMNKIKDYTLAISTLVDPEYFAAMSEKLKALPDYCKAALKKVMGDRMKEVGVIFDVTLKEFVKAPAAQETASEVVKPEQKTEDPVEQSHTGIVIEWSKNITQKVTRAFEILGLRDKQLADAIAQVREMQQKDPELSVDDAIDTVIAKLMETANPTGQP